ncbi:hypothetical protein [Propionigenium maris]|uniref:hypothetical protein n=1 Tax=Propionigenium maris TaxID=45622 RepID=UPI002490BB72|nr:hypothetical protein [Propionigenium maris]
MLVRVIMFAIGWLKFKGVDGAIIKRRLYQRNDTKQLYFRYKGQAMPHYEY